MIIYLFIYFFSVCAETREELSLPALVNETRLGVFEVSKRERLHVTSRSPRQIVGKKLIFFFFFRLNTAAEANFHRGTYRKASTLRELLQT